MFYKNSVLNRKLSVTMIWVLVSIIWFSYGCGSSNDNEEKITITILQTSDIHNHAAGYGPFLDYSPDDVTDGDEVLGGRIRERA